MLVAGEVGGCDATRRGEAAMEDDMGGGLVNRSRRMRAAVKPIRQLICAAITGLSFDRPEVDAAGRGV
jgi:hypothetical protein